MKKKSRNYTEKLCSFSSLGIISFTIVCQLVLNYPQNINFYRRNHSGQEGKDYISILDDLSRASGFMAVKIFPPSYAL